ncbi:MAG: bifunctional hydroxymethylpyrimidine kinase/phosphomethylpyrimidine kinase, partial [Methanoregulaceae archaeon]|nr:bifunctional hydroxymethylpyrimidine kinase/phosphomethylpyrimidine kinase [Methanoregulaceae archaeon]
GLPQISSIGEMREAGEAILSAGAEYVLVKGGHLTEGPAVDLLIGHGEVLLLSSPRHPSPAHGTGCCLSAAITAYIAMGVPVPGACRAAKEFVTLAISSAVGSRSGHPMVQPCYRKDFGGVL